MAGEMVVEVAAAVIVRPDGAFLLAQRPSGKVYAGYWEFPGGKVEPGEPVASALARELHEELGIIVERAYPWITRVFTYPHATVRLRFFKVVSWKNQPRSREKQAIAWQRPDAPLAAPMLPANAPVIASLGLPAEYAITDAASLGVPKMLERLKVRLESGLKLVQVREPHLSASERQAFTTQVIELAQAHQCKVMVKAPIAGAHGLHLSAMDLMAAKEKPAYPLVAASCHSREELEQAMRLGLDFAVLGPVNATPSHPEAIPMGWENFTKIAEGSTLPVYAIGGMKPAHLENAWRSGAHGLSMLSAAWTHSTQALANSATARR